MELLGIILPAFIDVLNRKVSDSDKRFWISVVVCSMVGIFINYIDTSFAFENARVAFDSLSASVLATFGIAQISYKALWENSTIRAKAFGISVTSNPENLK